MTAVMRPAEARFMASIMTSSSMRLSFTGLQVDCTMKASAPRTGSLSEGGDFAVAELFAEPVADGLGQRQVGVPGEHLYLFSV